MPSNQNNAIEERIKEVLRHQSIMACDAAIALQAIRTSTKGYTGEKLDVVLRKVLLETQKEAEEGGAE